MWPGLHIPRNHDERLLFVNFGRASASLHYDARGINVPLPMEVLDGCS